MKKKNSGQTQQQTVRRGLPLPRVLDWQLKIAIQEDVESAVLQLSGHMNERQREAFRDKLQRYVRKPDRELIVAASGPRIVGFICVIEKDPPPIQLPPHTVDRLKTFACGTGLMVHPDFRRRGIGADLQARAEQWARDRGKPGFWLVTHRKAQWYRKHFGYEEAGRVHEKGVQKHVMSKELKNGV